MARIRHINPISPIVLLVFTISISLSPNSLHAAADKQNLHDQIKSLRAAIKPLEQRYKKLNTQFNPNNKITFVHYWPLNIGLPNVQLPADTRPVTVNTPLKKGDAVFVNWLRTGSWYRATVLEPTQDNRIRVHYTTWPDLHDEVVARDTLRLHPEAEQKLQNELAALQDRVRRLIRRIRFLETIADPGKVGKKIDPRPAPAPVTRHITPLINPPAVPLPDGARKVDQDTGFDKGTPVYVEWSTVWWRGSVVEVRKDGRVKIHYTGWSSATDEIVTRNRLRLPPVKKRIRAD